MIELQILNVSSLGLMLNVGYDSDNWERLDLWQPNDPKEFEVFLDIEVGVSGMVGSNFFGVCVASKGIVNAKKSKWKSEYTLVVQDFNWRRIKSALLARAIGCQRKDWASSVQELRRHFFWEYEKGWPTRHKPEPLPDWVIPTPDEE